MTMDKKGQGGPKRVQSRSDGLSKAPEADTLFLQYLLPMLTSLFLGRDPIELSPHDQKQWQSRCPSQMVWVRRRAEMVTFWQQGNWVSFSSGWPCLPLFTVAVSLHQGPKVVISYLLGKSSPKSRLFQLAGNMNPEWPFWEMGHRDMAHLVKHWWHKHEDFSSGCSTHIKTWG